MAALVAAVGAAALAVLAEPEHQGKGMLVELEIPPVVMVLPVAAGRAAWVLIVKPQTVQAVGLGFFLLLLALRFNMLGGVAAVQITLILVR
jgi:hypothetical protein